MIIKFRPSKNIKQFGPILKDLFEEFGAPFWETIMIWCGIIKSEPDNRIWQIWRICNDKNTIGVCGLYSLDNRSKNLWLGWFGVLSEYRSHGIGGIALEFLKNKALDYDCIYLYTYVGYNNKKAIKFYQRNGFDIFSTVGKYRRANNISKDEFENDKDVIMRKRLSEPDCI